MRGIQQLASSRIPLAISIFGLFILLSVLTSLPQQTLATTDCTQVTEIPSEECTALVRLYDATSGSNWTHNNGWKTTNTPCNWERVTCQNGHVTELNVYSNNLSGSLPPELDNLSSLKILDLYGNQLSGNIPPEIGNLTSLQKLNLVENQLSGSIPAEMGNLSTLQELRMDTNQLSGSIPSELGNLSNLRILRMPWNDLSGSLPPPRSAT